MAMFTLYRVSVELTVNVPVAIDVTVGLASVPNVLAVLAYDAVQVTVVNRLLDKSTDSVAVLPARSWQLRFSMRWAKPILVTDAAPVKRYRKALGAVPATRWPVTFAPVQ